MIKYYTIILLIFFSLSVSAQVMIQFVPEISGRTLDGLFQCKIINAAKAQNAILTITVTERSQGIVCIVKTSSFALLQGTNSVPYTAARNASIRFSSNKIGQLARVNRQFAEGDYDYCFDVKLSQSDLPEEQCFSYLLAPFAELSLIEPNDQDKICDIRPLFNWQPLIPGIAGSAYQLVVSEIKAGQNATEALNYNLPVINQSAIFSPILPYPAVAPPLETGKNYAWQVTVYKDQTILNRSEIWQFKVDCQDTIKLVRNEGYRDIEDLSRGNYYSAPGLIRFALINPYRTQALHYEISSISKPDRNIKTLPKLQLRTGQNNLQIDLSDNDAFVRGNYYILKVWLPNGTVKSLRFLYEEAK